MQGGDKGPNPAHRLSQDAAGEAAAECRSKSPFPGSVGRRCDPGGAGPSAPTMGCSARGAVCCVCRSWVICDCVFRSLCRVTVWKCTITFTGCVICVFSSYWVSTSPATESFLGQSCSRMTLEKEVFGNTYHPRPRLTENR